MIRLLLLAVVLAGCTQERQTIQQTEKRTVTITRTVRDEIVGDQIVRLETITKSITDETGKLLGDEFTETKPPQIVGSLAGLVGKLAAVGTGSPQIGAAAEQVTDWVATLITGGTLAGTTAGAGYLANRRKRAIDETRERLAQVERQRNELIDGAEASKEALAAIEVDKDRTAWDLLTEQLERKQSHDTVRIVKERTP